MNKKLFRVSQEFNLASHTIVDTLAKHGLKVVDSPMSAITAEMYEVLEKEYREDKDRKKDIDNARQDYMDRKGQNRGPDSIGIDDMLTPIDDLEPEPEQHTLDPEDMLAPLDDIIEKKPEPVVEIIPEPTPEPEPAKEEPAPEPEKAPKQEEEVVAPQVSTPETKEVQSTEVAKEETVEKVVEAPKEEVKEEAPKQAEKKVEPEVIEEPEEVKPQEVIRAKRESLQGTNVLGKITFPEKKLTIPESAADKKKKKKKKRKVSAKNADAPAAGTPGADVAKPATTTTTPPAGQDAAGKKAKKKKGKGDKPSVDDEMAESKMKETMQKLQGGGLGKKRQKRRKARREEKAEEAELQELLDAENAGVLEVTEFITVSDLAELMSVTPAEMITMCMNNGMFVSINQRLDANSIELIAAGFDKEVRFIDAEEAVEIAVEEEEDKPEDLLDRPPVVTVMGHVDHGKTSLLDYIKNSKVAAGEAGGITQHIGAYAVKLEDGRLITFLDTPGHEAFTAMRARGAQATDIVILVVAADDSVMPQTIEAINHAHAGGVPIVVAINKMDKPEANPDRIKQQLSDHKVIVEEWGGKVQNTPVSAKTGMGIDDLLESVLVEAELMELKANPNKRASGVILESRKDKGKGVVASVLVQSGTLKVGDPFVAGQYSGRIRAMENELGERITQAGPSIPVQCTGFDGAPQAGDRLVVTPDEKTAKDISTQRQQIKREQEMRKVKHLTLDDLSRRMALGDIAELNIIIKGDVDGSIEALSGSLQKLSTEEVSVKIIHTGVGAITESDVLLASASDAIIIGFQVRPSTSARKLAENEEIDIRLFSVIYDAVDEVKDAMEGLLSPELKENILGTVEVRETFKVPSIGTIAGCYVLEGTITRNNKVRLIRDGIVIYDGDVSSLKRFKEDVREVKAGFECGVGIARYNDIKVGDQIESYNITETKRTLA